MDKSLTFVIVIAALDTPTPEDVKKYDGFDAFSDRFRETHCIFKKRFVSNTFLFGGCCRTTQPVTQCGFESTQSRRRRPSLQEDQVDSRELFPTGTSGIQRRYF